MSDKNITRLSFQGKEIVIIGTAHVSRESADLVEQTIKEEKPDTICVELCQSRLDAIRQHDSWREMDIVKVIREKRASLLLAQLLMASFQKRIAQKFQIQPGEEMRRAISLADDLKTNLVLADRSIRITLLRVWRMMSFWTKMKVLPEMFMSLFVTDEITEEDIEKWKEQDVLEMALTSFGEKMPAVKTALIDERDQYLAHMIRNAQGTKVVAVVGAGHVPGILRNMDSVINIDSLNQLPREGLFARYFGWIFSLAIISLFAAGFFYSGGQASINMIMSWSLITASCAAAGAILLFSHPFTIMASALAAPIATLHPLIATGWIAGLVEATVRKPQVKDVLNLADDITSFQGFFRNKITRILIIIAFVNITTSIGTFVAIPIMLKYF